MNSKIDVLVVDDEPAIVEILCEEITRKGLSCLSANDGKTGLEMIKSLNPKLILSDYMMPGLNGIELLQMMSDLGIKIPVIWLSGNAEPATFREAWRLGVWDFFEKPFVISEITNHCIQAIEADSKERISRRPKFLNLAHFGELHLDLPKSQLQELETHCIQNGTSISRFISELISKNIKPQ